MGQKIRVLSERELASKTIFDERFVVECCEKMHTHYRNVRIIQNLSDWEQMARGMSDAYERWKKLGEPPVGNKHIELCRKTVALFPINDNITISLNKNLYAPNEGRVFSEGAKFNDPEYIHLKIRDIRLEMPIDEFLKLADAVAEAKEELGVKV